MSWKCEHIQDCSLRPAANIDAFTRHLAALEWSLIDPIVINAEEDIKSTNWRDRGLQPFKHQVQNLITYCRRLPVALIADDVGLGKTISAGLILSELVTRRRVNRALVLCPKVLVPQWVAELDLKFGIVAVEATGAELDVQLERSTPVVVTTYESARQRLSKIEPGTFDLCILDEAHKLRNLHGTNKPPMLAERVREALERRPFRYVLMLTATPIQNKIWDLYSLIDLLKVAEGKPNPLGKPEDFAKRFLQPGTDGRKLRKDAAASFRGEVRGSLSRTRRNDVKLRFPDRHVQLVEVQLEHAELEMTAVVAQHIASLSALSQVSIAQAMMSSPRALVAQAANMSGSIPPSAVMELRNAAQRVPMPAKLKALLNLLDQLRKNKPHEWRALIFTVRRETQEMIGQVLRERGVACGFIRGADAQANQRSIADYSQSPPQVHAIVSTDAGAEGVNLQAGNVVINYDLPWNPMVVEQRIGRVQRLGSTFANVVVLNLVGKDTVESRIVARLTQKLQGICQAIGDVEGILEAAGLDDDGKDSFESRVRKMVVAALQGQDVAKSAAMVEKDIDEAKRLFEERRGELDQTLGNPKEGSMRASPVAPRVERKPPRLDAKDFILGAHRFDGYSPVEVEPGIFELTKPGRVFERISFLDDQPTNTHGAVFAKQAVRVCLPGKPAFERIVQHWVDHHGHNISEFRAHSDGKAKQLAQDWCRVNRCTFVDAVYQPGATSFQGRVHLRVRAGNGVDSFEKLLIGRVPRPEGHAPVPTGVEGERISVDVTVSKVLPQLNNSIRKAVERDDEIKQFCAFYETRLNDALHESGTDAHQSSKIRSDLQPLVHADIVAIDGLQYDSGTVQVRYRIEDTEYSSILEVVPACLQILREPKKLKCEASQADWPEDTLMKCSVTGRLALKHRLVQSQTGAYALPDQFVICEKTGERILKSDAAVSASGKAVKRSLLLRCDASGDLLLPEELVISDMSGRRGSRAKAVVSAISNRIGLADEGITCAATGRFILRDEAIQSKAGGKWFAKDQLAHSAVSGKAALPSELIPCELTGELALAEELEQCAITGKKVRRDRLGRSQVSGRYFLLDHAAYTDDGRTALPTEIGTCIWLGKRMLLSELSSCSLCGAIVDRTLLNEAGELGPLRQLLDGKSLGGICPKEDLEWLIRITGWKVASSAIAHRVAAPAANVYAVMIEERGWFGLQSRIVGSLVRFGIDGALLGAAVVGKRSSGRWVRQ
jgi:superfamily II DNA or RNA helicase